MKLKDLAVSYAVTYAVKVVTSQKRYNETLLQTTLTRKLSSIEDRGETDRVLIFSFNPLRAVDEQTDGGDCITSHTKTVGNTK